MYFSLARRRGAPVRAFGAHLRSLLARPAAAADACLGRPTLVGGCVVVGDGVGRELASIATLQLADASLPEEERWAVAAAALRSCSLDSSGGERVQMPDDVDVCVRLAVLLHVRADKGRLLHCSHHAAELAVQRIFAHVARRDIGLQG